MAWHYVWFSWFWSHFFLHYVYLGICTITSKAKINIFWKAKINVFWNFFFTPLAPSGPLRSKKFQKTLILAFEANSALSHENETKIVKITHSALLTFPISKFCLINKYKEAEDWLRTGDIEEEQCLSNRKHKSAQCSEASSNKRLGNLKTNDRCTAKRCCKNMVDWLVPRACNSTLKK